MHYPDPRLHTVARPVTTVDEHIRRLIQDMAETMYAAPGIGLAATQVDVHQQVVVIDISESRSQLLVLVNPQIVDSSGTQEYEEGCLSVPGIYETVRRAERVRMEALDVHGEQFSLEAHGLLLMCIQHEIDHLKGKVFVERLSQLKQVRIRNKLKKRMREIM